MYAPSKMQRDQSTLLMYDLALSAKPHANLGPIFESSIFVHITYNPILDLESRQKNVHFKKKWNLNMCPDKPILSI